MRLRPWLNSPDWLKMKNSDATGGEARGGRGLVERERHAMTRAEVLARKSTIKSGPPIWAQLLREFQCCTRRDCGDRIDSSSSLPPSPPNGYLFEARLSAPIWQRVQKI